MEQMPVRLTQGEYDRLERDHPRGGNKATELRAEEIVRIYLHQQDPTSQFERAKGGGDLRVISGGREFEIEVKGTDSQDISWQKLKVSSTASHDLLEGGMPLYRVAKVFEKDPEIYILHYSEDFELDHEPRWRVRPRDRRQGE